MNVSVCQLVMIRAAILLRRVVCGASLWSHDMGHGDDHQLGYLRCLRIESMRLRCAVILDSSTVLLTHVLVVCLPSMSASLSAPRSNKWQFRPAAIFYSQPLMGSHKSSHSEKDIRRDNSFTLLAWESTKISVGPCQGVRRLKLEIGNFKLFSSGGGESNAEPN
jgi:hypothetical protein